MGSSRTVTEEQIARVIAMREQDGLLFAEISRRMGWPRLWRASDIYHYYKGARRPLIGAVTIRAPKGDDDNGPIGGPGRVPDRIAADFAITRADAPPPSPSAKRCLGSLVAEDIALRIQRQGITAGLFGDPLPGRSALDMRRPSMREQGAR